MGKSSCSVMVTGALSPWVGAVVAAALHGAVAAMVWVMSGSSAVAAVVTGLASLPRAVDERICSYCPSVRFHLVDAGPRARASLPSKPSRRCTSDV